ncbi:hypothetical protein C7S20_05620 [Christiangramia fulva]|uniref:Uncharacterized protein n=1 Tax=Christiangramia fulva TaxID=2126553 RepID=A0A2R3Z3E4_9FLAO|nr:hypothetical protein [Christiangramia fulva]AVR44786.1 hypothetical protein C7S20_05620 [Christiangramia fulva]
MSTSTLHPHRDQYLKEIEKAFEVLSRLKKNKFYSVAKITWWILRYEDLYDYSYSHRHVNSCIDGMGCCCTDKNPEMKFSSRYSSLKEIVDLHRHEKYFREELKVFESVKNDYPALMQWLKKNETLGAEDFLLFWIEEWYSEEKHLITPYKFNLQDLDVKFKAEEWENTIKFCEVFNERYWNSGLCPEEI